MRMKTIFFFGMFLHARSGVCSGHPVQSVLCQSTLSQSRLYWQYRIRKSGLQFQKSVAGLDQSFVAYSAYGDVFSERYNSGVGLIINGARESFTQTQTNELALSYSYRLRLGESSFLHAGAQGAFLIRDALFDEVILGTQLDIDRGVIVGQPGDAFDGDSQLSSPDVHAGLFYYNERMWLGFAAHHLLRPEISYVDADSNVLPIRYSAHGGIRFSLAPGDINDYFNNTDQERSFALAFNYKSQGEFTQLDLGAEFFFRAFDFGIMVQRASYEIFFTK